MSSKMNQKEPKLLPVPGLLAGMFRSPSGVWVSVQKMNHGLPWARCLHAVTRSTVLRGAYGSKT